MRLFKLILLLSMCMTVYAKNPHRFITSTNEIDSPALDRAFNYLYDRYEQINSTGSNYTPYYIFKSSMTAIESEYTRKTTFYSSMTAIESQFTRKTVFYSSMTETERRINGKISDDPNVIVTTHVLNGAITGAKLSTNYLSATPDVVVSTTIKDGSVTGAKLSTNYISDTSDVITSTHLAHSISIATMLSGLNDIECADVFTSSGLAGIKANPTTNVSLTVGQATSGYESIKTQTTTTSSFVNLSNTGGYFYIGRTRSTGGDILSGSAAYAGVIAVGGVYPLSFGTDDTIRMTLGATGMVGIYNDLEVADVFYSSGTGDFQDNTKLKVNLAGQTIEGSSITVVKFGSLATGFTDTLSEVVGDGFRVVKSGFYSICGMFDIQHDSDTIQSIYCYKNHVEVGQSRNLGPAPFAYHQNKYTDFMYLAAGDLLEFFTDSSTSMRKISSATDKSYVIIYRVP